MGETLKFQGSSVEPPGTCQHLSGQQEAPSCLMECKEVGFAFLLPNGQIFAKSFPVVCFGVCLFLFSYLFCMCVLL